LVGVVVFPGANLLDVSGPSEVFSSLGEALGDERREAEYRIELISSGEPLVACSNGMRLMADRISTEFEGSVDTLIVPGGAGVWKQAGDRAFLGWLRGLASRSRRIGSVCTGAFLLAAAGLLEGRRATTHWRWCDRLALEYPEVAVEPDSIFVRDGSISSSAGVTAGIDLTLALLEEDLGRDVALAVARHLVMFVRRQGGQSQFSPLLEFQAAARQPLRELQDWLAEHLQDDLSVDVLAARVHMSPRNFARVFRREVGETPARFVEQIRVDAARRFLEESDQAIERIARDCGFGSADSMRRSFLRVLRVAPSDYRDRFRASAPAVS
jgi:transcriptional regulator GlxA family with amidase domain